MKIDVLSGTKMVPLMEMILDTARCLANCSYVAALSLWDVSVIHWGGGALGGSFFRMLCDGGLFLLLFACRFLLRFLIFLSLSLFSFPAYWSVSFSLFL